MNTDQISLTFLKLIFPENILEWFDPVSAKKGDKTIAFVFEEKNIPPVNDANVKITSKGFTDVTITDFPIRGKKTLLTFRRRYWKIEGRKELLKRDIKLSFPGTQLEKEFAVFLKGIS